MATETMSLPEQIRNLREKTGAGMMDCKKALSESNGDYDKAIEFLRKKGLAKAGKKAGRTTGEGLVATHVTDDGKSAGIVEFNCETDFVAKTDEFLAALKDFAKRTAEGSLAKAEDADEEVKALVGKLGENMKLSRIERFTLEGPGLIGAYVHSAGGKKGSLVQIKAATDEAAKSEAAQGLAKELGMQIVAFQPKWLDRSEVPAEAVAKEKEIFSEVLKKEGKPEAAIEKIVEGKLNKLFFQALCLKQQVSMRDNKTPLKKIVEEASKSAGGELEITRFANFQLGGGA
jgi:elongation factor Ts